MEHHRHSEQHEDRKPPLETQAEQRPPQARRAVNRLKHAAREFSIMHDRLAYRDTEPGARVNPACPDGLGPESAELVRMLAAQQRLRLAVAALLLQIGAHRAAAVMPDHAG